jgi:hypothetical protein
MRGPGSFRFQFSQDAQRKHQKQGADRFQSILDRADC